MTGDLYRAESTDEGTFGTIILQDGWTCFTGELPWRDNKSNISCVPPGSYAVMPFTSSTHGKCLKLENVPNRTDVEIHAGNWCGDVSMGYDSDLLGCIIVGTNVGPLGPDGQKAVLNSKVALEQLLQRVAQGP